MKTTTLLSAFLLLLLSACNSNEQPATSQASATGPSGFEKDSARFLTAVKSLETCCQFFIEQDSLQLTEAGLPLELNAVAENNLDEVVVGKSVSAMAGQLDALEDEVVPPFVRMHVVKKDDKPSASVLMFHFDSEGDAKDWVNRRDDVADDSVIYTKPKGILWAAGDKAYLVQTYNTPERDYVNLLKAELVKGMGK
ncbi:MAG TPA: hypothetical protein VK154_04295 [Chitinophagales bacterium]|nr:hypothetical protein [Chitinophagales bacterium]